MLGKKTYEYYKSTTTCTKKKGPFTTIPCFFQHTYSIVCTCMYMFLRSFFRFCATISYFLSVYVYVHVHSTKANLPRPTYTFSREVPSIHPNLIKTKCSIRTYNMYAVQCMRVCTRSLFFPNYFPYDSFPSENGKKDCVVAA